ncbi:MAG: hypothetical protein V1720_16615, partial [bacterium]
MDFLDKLVLPQSEHHMVLLKYLLVLTYLVFTLYAGSLLGSTLLSLVFKKKDEHGRRFSKEVIDLVTDNKYLPVAFGIVPLLSSAFCYAQLLHLSPVNVSGYILISIVFFVLSLYFIYTYKYSLKVEKIFDAALSSNNLAGYNDNTKQDLISLKDKALHRKNKYGMYGIIFLIISLYIFFGAAQLAADTSRWGSVTSILGIVFSFGALTSTVLFILFSLALTSAGVLYFYFRPSIEEDEKQNEFRNYLKKPVLNTGLVSLIASAFLIIINLVAKPANSLSSLYFGLVALLLILILLVGNLYYVMIKESSVKYSSSLLFIFVFIFLFSAIKEQSAFDTSTRDQFKLLSANYEEYHAKLLAESGIGIVQISGADIYNGKCIACHQFDKKIVGPPY